MRIEVSSIPTWAVSVSLLFLLTLWRGKEPTTCACSYRRSVARKCMLCTIGILNISFLNTFMWFFSRWNRLQPIFFRSYRTVHYTPFRFTLPIFPFTLIAFHHIFAKCIKIETIFRINVNRIDDFSKNSTLSEVHIFFQIFLRLNQNKNIVI